MRASVASATKVGITNYQLRITNYDGGEAVEAGGTPERSVNYQLGMLAQVAAALDESIRRLRVLIFDCDCATLHI